MANNTVFGVAECPHCGTGNPTAWSGNFRTQCYNCKKSFIVKRQKLKFVKPLYGARNRRK